MSPTRVHLIASAAVAAVIVLAVIIGLLLRPGGAPPDPARNMPGGPVAFVGLSDWSEVVRKINGSDWWQTLVTRLGRDKRFSAVVKDFRVKYRRRFQTTLESQLARLRTLLGGRVWIGFYSGLRGISLLAAVRPKRRVPLDELVARARRFSENLGHQTPPARWIEHEGERYRRLSLARRTVYVYSPDRETIYVSFRSRLIERVMDLIRGEKGPRLIDDPLYRRVGGSAGDRLRAFIRWDKLPARKRTGETLAHHVLDTIKSVRLVSNLIETTVAVEFRPGAATSLLGRGLPGGTLRSPLLLPRSPLIFYGSCGHSLAQVWKGLLAAAGPAGQPALRRLDKALGRAFGAAGLAELLQKTGNEAAVAVLGLHPGPLPLPQVLVMIRMKDARTADKFLPELVAAAKRHRELGRFVFETRRVGGRTMHYLTAPPLGQVGAVVLGPFIVVGNNLDLLRDVIERRHVDPTDAWQEALRIERPSSLLFFDLTQILKLAPGSLPYLAPWLRLPRPVLDRFPRKVQAAVNVLSFFRGATLWTRWEAKSRVLTLGLRLDLADAEVTTRRAGEALLLWPFSSAGGRVEPARAPGGPKPK
jgi:hypothetical protein